MPTAQWKWERIICKSTLDLIYNDSTIEQGQNKNKDEVTRSNGGNANRLLLSIQNAALSVNTKRDTKSALTTTDITYSTHIQFVSFVLI